MVSLPFFRNSLDRGIAPGDLLPLVEVLPVLGNRIAAGSLFHQPALGVLHRDGPFAGKLAVLEHGDVFIGGAELLAVRDEQDVYKRQTLSLYL